MTQEFCDYFTLLCVPVLFAVSATFGGACRLTCALRAFNLHDLFVGHCGGLRFISWRWHWNCRIVEKGRCGPLTRCLVTDHLFSDLREEAVVWLAIVNDAQCWFIQGAPRCLWSLQVTTIHVVGDAVLLNASNLLFQSAKLLLTGLGCVASLLIVVICSMIAVQQH